MADFISYLQNRVAETKQELQALSDRITKATAERDVLSAELQGYEKALSAEMRRQGIALLPSPNSEQSQSLVYRTDAQNEDADGTNKAEFARRFIRERSGAGVTPRELLNAFASAGVAIRPNYVYSLVQRLQAQTVIEKRNGKWYPVPKSGDAVNGGGAPGGQPKGKGF